MKKTDDNRDFKIRQRGEAGERYVREYLEKRGCTITAANFSCRYGEIDIIAENEVRIIFVEVKTVTRASMSSGFARITPVKLRKFLAATGVYLSKNPTNKQPRVDCAQVLVSQKDNSLIKIDYIKNAAEQTGDYSPL